MVKIAKSLPSHDLENLESIPGFAQTTAVKLLTELGYSRRFSNSIELVLLSVLITA